MTLKIHGKLKFIGSIYYFKKLARGTHGSEGFQITITITNWLPWILSYGAVMITQPCLGVPVVNIVIRIVCNGKVFFKKFE
jgi:hypothetical protein